MSKVLILKNHPKAIRRRLDRENCRLANRGQKAPVIQGPRHYPEVPETLLCGRPEELMQMGIPCLLPRMPPPYSHS